MTLSQAKLLLPGDMLHHVSYENADGTPQRWRVNGKPQVWKRDPTRVRVPVKHGLYTYDQITESYLDQVEIASLTPRHAIVTCESGSVFHLDLSWTDAECIAHVAKYGGHTVKSIFREPIPTLEESHA